MRMRQTPRCAVVNLLLLAAAVACGQPGSARPAGKISGRQLADSPVDELWGDSGLFALERQRAQAQRPATDPRDDLSPDDPADLPQNTDCAALRTQSERQQVDLNQEANWHALLQSADYRTFAALARAANAQGCRMHFKDPGEAECDATPPATPQDGNVSRRARQLAYGCDVLTDKLGRAYARLEASDALASVRQLLIWQRLLGQVELWHAAHCDRPTSD